MVAAPWSHNLVSNKSSEHDEFNKLKDQDYSGNNTILYGNYGNYGHVPGILRSARRQR